MPPYGEPDWATPGDTSTATQNVGTGGSFAAASAPGGGQNVNTGEAR